MALHLRIAVGVCLAALTVPLVPPATAADDEPATRVLIVGDSVTQGSTGDWTWRYRLWKQLEASDAAVNFVGPRTALHGLDTSTEDDDHTYADPAFDQDHAARWGMLAWHQEHPVGELVAEYQPDVILEQLGINDLLYGQQPHAAADDIRKFVTDAQAADPDVDVVLGELPQVWVEGVAEFNADLPTIAAELSTETSAVTVAHPPAFVREVDIWDFLHPAATGELKLAAGFAVALAALGIGARFPEPLPVVANGPSQVAALSVFVDESAAALSWTPPPGATRGFVWMRDRTLGEDWSQIGDATESTTLDVPDLVDFHRYQFRVQSAKGDAVSQRFSNVVEVVLGDAPAAATDLRAARVWKKAAVLRWLGPVSATRFEVLRRSRGGEWRRAGWSEGRRYRVPLRRMRGMNVFRVRAWTVDLEGGASARLRVVKR